MVDFDTQPKKNYNFMRYIVYVDLLYIHIQNTSNTSQFFERMGL